MLTSSELYHKALLESLMLLCWSLDSSVNICNSVNILFTPVNIIGYVWFQGHWESTWTIPNVFLTKVHWAYVCVCSCESDKSDIQTFRAGDCDHPKHVGAENVVPVRPVLSVVVRSSWEIFVFHNSQIGYWLRIVPLYHLNHTPHNTVSITTSQIFLNNS